ncbi:hypothetical protein [Saliphagus sp. LR7]|uniref:hypothetical protein n=1 Tax=Saliphagus sp. LR7 TaxID=2282654 RepID=UPI0013008EE7|nr:hypothetical protein [Saliphagus sp. LR7]
MPDSQTMIILISVFGAVGQAAVTLRWYEPPPREDQPPIPVFEGVLFLVGFTVLFVGLGFVLSFIRGIYQPYGELLTLLLTPIGFYSAYGTFTRRLNEDKDKATRMMNVVGALVVGIYPMVLFLV